jgi:hypothetical protein
MALCAYRPPTLIHIKPWLSTVENTAELFVSSASPAGTSMVQEPKLRFAVGTFDSWPQVRAALRDLRARGVVLDNFNCLALQRLFADKTIVAPDQASVAVAALPFADGADVIACTSGPLADKLTEQTTFGARTLQDALGRWIIPRHAARFEDAVHAGKILFWIQVANADEERRACQTLLAHSSNSVDVHDLVRPGAQ